MVRIYKGVRTAYQGIGKNGLISMRSAYQFSRRASPIVTDGVAI